MTARIIAFKPRPAVAATPTEQKRRLVGAFFSDTFDSFTRLLIDPHLPYESRVKLVNEWREEWKLEPLYNGCGR